MNGPQDLGGMHGFGPVIPEKNEPIFHAEWERRALAITLAMGATGMWNIDVSRHARERMAPADYLSSSYYEIWMHGLQTLIREHGLATAEEMRTGKMLTPPNPAAKRLEAENVAAAMARGAPANREPETKQIFELGDRVRTLNLNPPGHIRMPRYSRGREGIIEQVHGVHVFPDSNGHHLGEDPQWLYGVRFTARELFGDAAGESDTIRIDLWEPYLEHA